jgi:hypothetical protein
MDGFDAVSMKKVSARVGVPSISTDSHGPPSSLIKLSDMKKLRAIEFLAGMGRGISEEYRRWPAM